MSLDKLVWAFFALIGALAEVLLRKVSLSFSFRLILAEIHRGWSAEAAFGVGCFVFREEPEANGYLRVVEELAGKGDDSVNEGGVDEAHNRLLYMID